MRYAREWGEKHSEAEVRELLEQNPSFVSLPQSLRRSKAPAPPLIDWRASVASDRSIIRPARPCYAEVPLLITTVNLAVSMSYV